MVNTTQDQSRNAAQVQVPLAEIARAVAVIEARKRAEALEAANTVIIGEALQGVSSNCTPGELWAEILRLRAQAEQDQLARAAKQRRHLMGYAGAALAFLAAAFALSLKMTVYNPRWQAWHQRQIFIQDLALARGPNPVYHIVIAPEGILLQRSLWDGKPTYPISLVPDGYPVHTGLEAPITNQSSFSPNIMLNKFSWMAPGISEVPPYSIARPDDAVDKTLRVSILPADDLMFNDNVFTVHHGICYQEGWVAKSDIYNVLHHHHFIMTENFHSLQTDWPPGNRQNFAELNLPFSQILQQRANIGWTADDDTATLILPEGQNLTLDQYAWQTN